MTTTPAQINYKTLSYLGLIATSFCTGQIQSPDGAIVFNIRAAGYAESSFLEISTNNCLITLFASHEEKVAHVGRINDKGVVSDDKNSQQSALDSIALSLILAIKKNNSIVVFDNEFQAAA